MTLNLSVDEVLTTTRSVRKRLDFDKPVPRDVLMECLELALQAPTGSNSQGWQWVFVEDAAKKKAIADVYPAIGLVKFDLLGLGMLSALHYAKDLVAEHKGIEVDLARLDLSEPAVYEMLARADSVGVFQVESRAQMATLPRLKPRVFYDLVVSGDAEHQLIAVAEDRDPGAQLQCGGRDGQHLVHLLAHQP